MVYVFLADGFEEIEAIAPIDILRRGGADVLTVGVTGMTVTGAHGIKVAADIEISGVKTDDSMEMVVLPGGGPGTENLKKSARVSDILKTAVTKNCFIAAICAAPSILGEMGLLEGKNAVCYPGFENKLKGAKISADYVVFDGKVITAKGAGVAAEFGFELLGAIKGADAAEKVRAAMQFQQSKPE
jgi:4-methyl-5(b-hydroxyethyl)-thiazole monophosphate biosynthesis